MKVKEKYAPQNLNEIIYPNKATANRIQAVASGQLTGHVLLWGPNGTAKTTIANLLIQAIGGVDAMVDDTQYDVLLSKPDLNQYLKNACALSSFSEAGKFFVLLNEFDTSKGPAHKLWTAMDECGSSLMVIITTNEPMKVHRSIRSRCTEINMPALSAQAVVKRAQVILATEGLVLPDAQVLHYLVTKQHTGDLRKYFELLDELLFLHNTGQPMPPWQATKPKLTVVNGA
ncbi:AAA family ATPase [Zwartia vadi]|uniref:AAA family ATPase n=1 Tax=Zwartia vadi TaxID=3058168 RepID=UPI0025B2A506|nr:AAA family ATPase [Zwartia vadi]MDN3988883.1 AAA family ATPase [Zwartia vadi]